MLGFGSKADLRSRRSPRALSDATQSEPRTVRCPGSSVQGDTTNRAYNQECHSQCFGSGDTSSDTGWSCYCACAEPGTTSAGQNQQAWSPGNFGANSNVNTGTPSSNTNSSPSQSNSTSDSTIPVILACVG